MVTLSVHGRGKFRHSPSQRLLSVPVCEFFQGNLILFFRVDLGYVLLSKLLDIIGCESTSELSHLKIHTQPRALQYTTSEHHHDSNYLRVLLRHTGLAPNVRGSAMARSASLEKGGSTRLSQTSERKGLLWCLAGRAAGHL